jgi:prevent-host-death family protein
VVTATVFEAKTKLSELLRKVEAGETVVITSGRERKPVARLMPIEDVKPEPKRRLGFLEGKLGPLDDDFWRRFDEPLPEEELRLWNGEGD